MSVMTMMMMMIVGILFCVCMATLQLADTVTTTIKIVISGRSFLRVSLVLSR